MSNFQIVKSSPQKSLNFFDQLEEKLTQEATKPQYEFVSLNQIYEMEFPRDQWAVEGLVPISGLTCIGALPGVGKSMFTNYLAACISQGLPVLDRFKTTKSNILFIDKENRLKDIKTRFSSLISGSETIFYLKSGFILDNDSDLTAVIEFSKNHDIKMIFIDTLVRVHQYEENSATEMNRAYLALLEIQNATGAGICFIHHFNKQGYNTSNDVRHMLRGSGDILAMVDSFIALSSKKPFIEIEHAKSRNSALTPKFLIEALFDQKQTHYSFVKQIDDEEIITSAIAEDDIEKMLSLGSITRPSLLRDLGEKYSRGTIDRALGNLKKLGEIVSFKNGSKDTFYSLNRKDLFHTEDEQ